MPRPSRRQLSIRRRLRHDNGHFIRFNKKETQEKEGSVCASEVTEALISTGNTVQNSINININDQLSCNDNRLRINNDPLSINNILKDSNTKQRARGIYTKDSRTTKYRKRKEAEKIDTKQTLLKYGYISAPKEPAEVEIKETHK